MTFIFLAKLILVFISTLVGTILILPRLIHIASTWIVTKYNNVEDENYSLMDFPDNERKVHSIPKPLVGGLGMLAVVSFSSILFVPPEDLNLRGYYSAVVMLGIVGFLDDFKNLHYRWKFIAQVLAAIIMIHYSRTALLSLGDLLSFGSINFGLFSISPMTIFCTVGVINAINMMDGLDGLAGGVSLIAFIAFAVLAFINQQWNIMLLSAALIGALLGFLKYNWYPSKLFMGDAGSFFLGFSLAFLSIYTTQIKDSIVPPVAALLILAVPIVDTLSIMVKRLIKGRSPFSADRIHLHHIFMRYGLDVKQTVIAILCLSGMFAIIAVTGTIFNMPAYYLFFIFLIYLILHFTASFFLKKP